MCTAPDVGPLEPIYNTVSCPRCNSTAGPPAVWPCTLRELDCKVQAALPRCLPASCHVAGMPSRQASSSSSSSSGRGRGRPMAARTPRSHGLCRHPEVQLLRTSVHCKHHCCMSCHAVLISETSGSNSLNDVLFRSAHSLIELEPYLWAWRPCCAHLAPPPCIWAGHTAGSACPRVCQQPKWRYVPCTHFS